MTHRLAMAALAVLGMIGVTALPSASVADERNNVRAGDNTVDLPDEPANDEELSNEAGSPPQSVGANVPLGQNDDLPASTLPAVGSGALSTYSGNNTGIAVSTVNAAITNNDFHN